MKKLLRNILCVGLLAVVLSVPAFAARADSMPEKQGDFYVLVNGEFVTFTDAVPQLRDSRSYLPLVAVFNQLGFTDENMTWDAETETVTATKGDLTISLTIGEKKITITEDSQTIVSPDGTTITAGKTQVIDTDVAPYLDHSVNRTYIPFGLVAEALNYNVGWDDATRTVIIDDVDTILANNAETYELADKYRDYSNTFAEKNYKVTGKYDMGMDIVVDTAEEDAAMNFDINGDYEMYMAGSTAFQFDTDMIINMSMEENGVDVTKDALGEDANMFPMGIDVAMRGDLEDGVIYFQSEALCEMLETGMKNTWFKIDMAAMMDGMSDVTGMDYAALMEMSTATITMTFEEYLDMILRSMPLTTIEHTTTDMLDTCNAILADSSFKYANGVHTSTIEQDGVLIKFSLVPQGTVIKGYSMTMTTTDPSLGEISMVVGMEDNSMTMKISFDMDITEQDGSSVAMNMTMNMDGTYQVTSKTPVTAPPTDASVVDLFQMMGVSMEDFDGPTAA